MIRVAILGASGYSALELIKLLLRHPEAEITALTTRQTDAQPRGRSAPVACRPARSAAGKLSPSQVAERADCVFCCLPHGASAAAVAELLPRGKKVIDLSADYRLNDPAEYEKWYGVEHPDPKRMPKTVYGLPELYRERNQDGRSSSPTRAAIRRRRSWHSRRCCEPARSRRDGIIIDSKSGVSGGGREPKPHLHFPECNESVVGLRRRHASPHAGDRPGALRRGRQQMCASCSRRI